MGSPYAREMAKAVLRLDPLARVKPLFHSLLLPSVQFLPAVVTPANYFLWLWEGFIPNCQSADRADRQAKVLARLNGGKERPWGYVGCGHIHSKQFRKLHKLAKTVYLTQPK